MQFSVSAPHWIEFSIKLGINYELQTEANFVFMGSSRSVYIILLDTQYNWCQEQILHTKYCAGNICNGNKMKIIQLCSLRWKWSLTNKLNFTYLYSEKKQGAREFEFLQEGYVNYQSVRKWVSHIYIQAASKFIRNLSHWEA